ncbi:MAG: hypothetical protein IPK22_02945 [Verrucomicrobiaceae bacterium]|nr:hypothetical protein [Verrucomicrobiaceae bacterium]
MESNTIRESSPKTGYSAKVQLFLEIGRIRHDVPHMGPEFIILPQPPNHPPCQAIVGLSVEGQLKQWPVSLPDGLSEKSPRVRTAKAA